MNHKKLQFVFYISLLCIIACNNNNNEETNSNNYDPTLLNYTVTATYPHDTSAYTEGLEWHDGFLYESTGDINYSGKSKVVKFNLQTGKVLQEIKLDKKYFGEGITLLNGKLYQMTYKENKCFVYDATTFKKINEFTYDGEGWGFTNNGRQLIMSNGSSTIYFRNPNDFSVLKTITVSNNYGPLSNINELELVDGFLFANVWTTKKIIKIDTTSGKVVAEINFDDLLTKYASDAYLGNVDVLNGIAYDSVGKRFFITGKYYPKIFEVKFH